MLPIANGHILAECDSKLYMTLSCTDNGMATKYSWDLSSP